jgi:hypothetical protein
MCQREWVAREFGLEPYQMSAPGAIGAGGDGDFAMTATWTSGLG